MNDRQWTEEEIQFMQELTDATSAAPDFHSALHTILLQICQVTNWNYGEAWIPSENGAVAELSPVWHIDASSCSTSILNLEQFRLCSESLVFPPTIGLPGRVWASRQPEWVADASAQSETYFLRNQIAKAFGVKAGFGIPILTEQQVLAVLVFFMLEARQENKQLVELVVAVSLQLGPLLQAFLCNMA